MIEDYNRYQYTKREWIKYFLQGAVLGSAVGFLFYFNIISSLLLMPYGFLWVHNKRKQLIKERKWKLNLEFRDGLASISAALNAGYSMENAFVQAITDLKLIYSPEAFIIREFEGMVRQIHMNQTVEEVLMNFADRSDIDDILNFTEVFVTAKRTGGDIIKIIQTAVTVIGDKVDVKREIRTMITAKKYESSIMNLIPFGIIVYLQVFSPGYLDPLYNNLFGFVFMTIVLLCYYFAISISKRIIAIEV